MSFLLWPSCFILSGAVLNCPFLFPISILDTSWPGLGGASFSYLFSFLYCSWGSHGKNTEVGYDFLLQWTTFCQNSSLWPIHLGCPCTAWLIASLSYSCPFTTTKAVIHEGNVTNFEIDFYSYILIYLINLFKYPFLSVENS